MQHAVAAHYFRLAKLMIFLQSETFYKKKNKKKVADALPRSRLHPSEAVLLNAFGHVA